MADLRVSFPKPCDQKWERMDSEGKNRFCNQCAKTIHDLRHYTLDEAETLLRSGDEICVRAAVDANGAVTLKSSGQRSGRQMVAALSASLALMAVGSQPALAKNVPEGSIAGRVANFWSGTQVTAMGADGKKYTVKVRDSGHFKIKHVPPGSYELRFSASGGKDWAGGSVVVKEHAITISNTTDPNEYIIVGAMSVRGDES